MQRLYKKVMRDLFKDKRRAIFSLLAILIGTMSFGIAAFSYEIIPREIINTYNAINPPSATITVNRIDEQLLELTESFEGISVFEQRAFHQLRAQIGENEWKPLELYSALDFPTMQVNRITSEEGSLTPAIDEILIERDALRVAGGVHIGDSLAVVFPDGYTRDFNIAGIVADLHLHPASIHDTVYAYVSHETLLDLGLANNMIDFIVTENQYDREHILTVSNAYIQMLEQNGYIVRSLYVPRSPGISMHLEEFEVGLVLLQVFSVVSLLLGCMIMSGLISAIISSQTRQIGILKSIGASTKKIINAYMLVFFIVILLTTAISAILSTVLAGGFSTALMSIGNLRPDDVSIPLHLYILFCGVALTVPMFIAYFPIRRGVSITVKDAINDYGISSNENGVKFPEPKSLSRPVLLSLRNALRRKRRFLLNIAILSIAGTMLVSGVTAMISMQTTMNDNLDMWSFDYVVVTNATLSDSELSEVIAEVPHVNSFERWGASNAMLLNEQGEITRAYRVWAQPPVSTMLEPDMMEGRWLEPNDTNHVVVSHGFFNNEPHLNIGDTIDLQVGTMTSEFVIVGSMKDFGTATIYMSESGFEQYVPQENRISNILFDLDMTSRARAIFRDVNGSLDEQGILILQAISRADLNIIVREHFNITMQTFMFIIFMTVVVSGFGLAATMNTQTSERTKEIGIMKAMGASRKQIMRIITAESIFIALISWGIAILLGVPFGVFSVSIFGNMVLETPLVFNVLPLLISFVVWLVFTVVIGYLASRSCAKRASRMSVKSSLAFE
jgi:putative ABC transport system permease protein